MWRCMRRTLAALEGYKQNTESEPPSYKRATTHKIQTLPAAFAEQALALVNTKAVATTSRQARKGERDAAKEP